MREPQTVNPLLISTGNQLIARCLTIGVVFAEANFMTKLLAFVSSSIVILSSGVSHADPATPIDLTGEEVIHVYATSHATTLPILKSDPELLPPYSDDAILTDVWSRHGCGWRSARPELFSASNSFVARVTT